MMPMAMSKAPASPSHTPKTKALATTTAPAPSTRGQMLEAGANCLPTALKYMGIAALSYTATPRASAAISYGVLVLTFLWQAVGALLGAPGWLVGLTPFAHIGLVPTEPFRATAAVVMIAIGLAAAAAALAVFRRRDLISA